MHSSFSSTQTKSPPNLHPFSPPHSLPSLPTLFNPQNARIRTPLKVRSMDYSPHSPHDHHLAQPKSLFHNPNSLKIAVIGFGNFGQFLARTFVRQGHTVLAHSRSDHSSAAQKFGATFIADLDDLCEQHPEVVVLCTSILSTESVIKTIPFQRLRRNTLFVDVLSVKEFPRDLFLKHLPEEFDILCTHPMFGPQSGRFSWVGLPLVYDKVRIGSNRNRVERCEKFLGIFSREGCRMVEMSGSEDARFAAGSQFVTHTMGRILEKFRLESSPINTKGYETLLNLVHNTAGDSFDLYYGLFMYNKNAMEQIERLDMAYEALKKELFGRLHEVCRRQLFGNISDEVKDREEERSVPKLLPGSAPRNNVNGHEIGEFNGVRSNNSKNTIGDEFEHQFGGVLNGDNNGGAQKNGSVKNGSLKLSDRP